MKSEERCCQTATLTWRESGRQYLWLHARSALLFLIFLCGFSWGRLHFERNTSEWVWLSCNKGIIFKPFSRRVLWVRELEGLVGAGRWGTNSHREKGRWPRFPRWLACFSVLTPFFSTEKSLAAWLNLYFFRLKLPPDSLQWSGQPWCYPNTGPGPTLSKNCFKIFLRFIIWLHPFPHRFPSAILFSSHAPLHRVLFRIHNIFFFNWCCKHTYVYTMCVCVYVWICVCS